MERHYIIRETDSYTACGKNVAECLVTTEQDGVTCSDCLYRIAAEGI